MHVIPVPGLSVGLALPSRERRRISKQLCFRGCGKSAVKRVMSQLLFGL